MPKRMFINVKDDVDLSKLNKNDVLLYDKTAGCFYSASMDTIFAESKKFEKAVSRKIAEIENKFNDFLKKYQETNRKLIDTIDKIAKGDK